MELHGKVGLVTGASGGIGAAVARRLHDAGASVGLLAGCLSWGRRAHRAFAVPVYRQHRSSSWSSCVSLVDGENPRP